MEIKRVIIFKVHSSNYLKCDDEKFVIADDVTSGDNVRKSDFFERVMQWRHNFIAGDIWCC
jgi:hypothetical protein